MPRYQRIAAAETRKHGGSASARNCFKPLSCALSVDECSKEGPGYFLIMSGSLPNPIQQVAFGRVALPGRHIKMVGMRYYSLHKPL